ncbi:MAG: protein translocase subunit SecD [Armatimonadetes bacterium]|nr:protein translocase subunit SecD [Armatimonadota bacterium]
MQYRPKLWIAILLALLVCGFEIGFQPIRFIHHKQTMEAAVDFDLGQPAATDEAGLTEKLATIRTELAAAGLKEQAIKDLRFVTPSRLRLATTALTDEQRNTDKSMALSTLQKQFKGVKAIDAAPEDAEAANAVARMGPIGVFRPVPNVRLGLDLQGGAHVVLQCKPSTEMTFATPEDRPMWAEAKGKESEKPAEPAAKETKSETKTETKAEEKAAESKEGKEAPSEETGTEEKASETPEAKEPPPAETKSETKTESSPGGPWKPGETRESLLAKIEKLLKDEGVPAFEAGAPAPNRLLVKTQSTSEEQVTQQQDAILKWLNTRYEGVKIDAGKPSSVFVTRDTAAKAKHIIDLRLYSMSEIKEPIVQTQGQDRIIVELPGVKEPERVTKILQSTAQLEFRLVPERYSCPGAGDNDYTSWEDSQTGQRVTERRVLDESPVQFTGADLKPNAAVVPSDVPSQFEVQFEIKESRKREFAEFTRNNVGRIMSIILDDETKMAPVIKSEIPGQGVISGDMDAQDAGELRLLLNAGALPVPLEIVENRTVSATLGENAIRQSIIAGIVGFILVAMFMVAYYRLPGLLADFALTLYVVLLLALLSTWSPIQTTLTLPGIAGIILSIGMAVDANVIIFERIREELRVRTTTRAAVEAGFHRAWPAILDANVTTVIGAAALYFFGTSSIKSFAVTLLLGVCTHLFTAVTASRWLVHIVARTHLGENRALFGVEPLETPAVAPAGGSE